MESRQKWKAVEGSDETMRMAESSLLKSLQASISTSPRRHQRPAVSGRRGCRPPQMSEEEVYKFMSNPEFRLRRQQPFAAMVAGRKALNAHGICVFALDPA